MRGLLVHRTLRESTFLLTTMSSNTYERKQLDNIKVLVGGMCQSVPWLQESIVCPPPHVASPFAA